MNPMYIANYLILSVFLTLFVLDVGIAIMLLTPFKRQRAAWIRYITPIWELEGTFAVFYLVNLVATYPKLLGLVAGIYVLPAIAAGVFLLVGNAFLAYSEYSKSKASVERYLKVYSVATIIVAFLFAGIFGSALSGIGINVATGTGSILAILFNPVSILLFFVIALLGAGLVGIIFRVKGMRYLSLAMVVGATLLLFCILAAYTNYIHPGIVDLVAFVVLPTLVLGGVCALRLRGSRWAGPLSIFWLALSVNLLGILQYPYVFDGKATLLNYLNNATIAGPINAITLIGGSMLSVAIIYFIYVSYIKR